jgi:hypothetical protein
MIPVGDPLNTPFKKNPALQSIAPEDLEIVPGRESFQVTFLGIRPEPVEAPGILRLAPESLFAFFFY